MTKSPASLPLAADAGAGESLACLVVEDKTLIGQLVAGMLRTLPGIGGVRLAATVADGIAAVTNRRFDLLVLDLMLPDGDGLDVLRAAVNQGADVVGIVLSAAAEECRCPTDLAPHVAALLDKTVAVDTLRFEVEAVVRRRLGKPPATQPVDPGKVLRPRELEVFERIGQGMSTRDIAASLGITVHTVNTHRKAIVGRLGVVGAELVRVATIYNQSRRS
jgi:DNA-binding NarL/FixJ family response regulator